VNELRRPCRLCYTDYMSLDAAALLSKLEVQHAGTGYFSLPPTHLNISPCLPSSLPPFLPPSLTSIHHLGSDISSYCITIEVALGSRVVQSALCPSVTISSDMRIYKKYIWVYIYNIILCVYIAHLLIRYTNPHSSIQLKSKPGIFNGGRGYGRMLVFLFNLANNH
jgi:hypothetical protein